MLTTDSLIFLTSCGIRWWRNSFALQPPPRKKKNHPSMQSSGMQMYINHIYSVYGLFLNVLSRRCAFLDVKTGGFQDLHSFWIPSVTAQWWIRKYGLQCNLCILNISEEKIDVEIKNEIHNYTYVCNGFKIHIYKRETLILLLLTNALYWIWNSSAFVFVEFTKKSLDC